MEGCKLPPRRPQGDVKEELAGRQREANEWNGKCIQGGVGRGGGTPALSYSYQLIQYLSMEVCTVGGGHSAGEWGGYGPSPLSPRQRLYYSTVAGRRSLALRESRARPGELRRF